MVTTIYFYHKTTFSRNKVYNVITNDVLSKELNS